MTTTVEKLDELTNIIKEFCEKNDNLIALVICHEEGDPTKFLIAGNSCKICMYELLGGFIEAFKIKHVSEESDDDKKEITH